VLSVAANDAPDVAIGSPKATRIRLSEADNGAASFTIFDTAGRPRCVIYVASDGKPWVTFLNEAGASVKSIDGSSWL
jgi:hypothetical protein